jgi:polyisoprenoid-binding protein YceI
VKRWLPVVLTLVVAASSEAQDRWRIARGEVRVVCPLSVGGSFEIRSDGLVGLLAVKAASPAAFAGDLSVPLSSLDTGIGLRNDHMRNNYLEIARGPGFDRATLSAIVLPDTEVATASGKVRFTGQLLVHGVTRPVEGTAEIRRSATLIRIAARLPIHLPDFAIASPRYLGVGVRDDVQVTVSLEAVPAGMGQ